MDYSALQNIIQNRRSVYPNCYTKQPIHQETINSLLELANWAPTHKLTEPWRFKVFHSEESRKRLSHFLGNAFLVKNNGLAIPEIKYKKTIEKPLQAQCVIAICNHRDEKGQVPEWEEIAAVSCAVQNIWLGCTALNIGAYWSSPSAIIEERDFLELTEQEKCLGLFYMGYKNDSPITSTRSPIADKTVFL